MRKKIIDLKIEKGIPVPFPEKIWGRWPELADKMKKGDSVVVRTSNDKSALMLALRRVGKKSVGRHIVDNDTFRVWVVE